MRRHGLQAPLDPHQVASWIVFFTLVSGVYAFYMPFVEDAGIRWFLVALYSALVVAIVSLDLYTSYLDPSDPGLTGATDGEFFCGLCQASVARSSKHCRACDRCVEGFDHHCKWLNNCVGARNYWHFFGLISSTVSMLILQFAWGLWLFIRSFTEGAEMRSKVSDKYGASVVYGGWQAALAIYMALLVTAIIMLGELFFFHVVLISKGLTTYDYIIAQRDARLAAPPAGPRLKACRSGRVADTTTAKPKIKVGLNPCAAMRTSKPKGSPAPWDASKPAGPSGNNSRAIPPASISIPPLSSPTFRKPDLEDVSSGSLGGKEAALVLSDKAAAVGSVQDLVSRAVAEQTTQSGALREEAMLRSAAGGLGSPSCVPECSTTASGGGAAEGGSGRFGSDGFTSLMAATGVLGAGAEAAASSSSPGRSGGPLDWGGGGGSGAGPGPGVTVAGFDAAVVPAGRHLGGHAAGSPGCNAAPQSSPAPLAYQRPKSLPPLNVSPLLPGKSASEGIRRSLLFPGKSSPPGGEAGALRELTTTPE